jgi:hypothetical protein
MLLRLSCTCGWKVSRRVPEHTLRDHLELILRQHPQDSHVLTPVEKCKRPRSIEIHRFLAEKRIGIGYKEAPCKADGFALSGR